MEPSSAALSGSSAAGNVAGLVRAAADADPGHPALIDATSGRRLSWGELDAAVDATAHMFASAGAGDGDRVVVRLSGTTAYCITLFGALRAGCVVVPIARRSAPRELDEVLASSGAKILVGETDDEVASAAAEACEVLVLPPPDAADQPVPPFASQRGGEDLAVLAYTSGSSGTARGVMLSHRALLANVDQCARLRPAPVTAADRVLLALPLFHVYGLGPGLLQVACAGATAVLAGRFDAAESLAAIMKYRVTTVVGVPSMYRAWLKLGTEALHRGFRTVRLLTSGAAPLERSLFEAFWQATGLGIFEGYGLTETGPVLTSTLASGTPKPGSVGRPIPGVELRLVDADGRPLRASSGAGVGTSSGSGAGSVSSSGTGSASGSGTGSASGSGWGSGTGSGWGDDFDDEDEDATGTGLVAARGANLLTGYWPSGENGPDAAGWFRTGDVGFLDADGDLHLVDRTSDLIIVNGFNVYPHEVERALLEHPAIAQAAVVGMPDEDTGETVRAVLVLADDAELTTSALDAHCAVRLARYKMPTTISVVDELPVTATGKLARRALRTLQGRPLPS